MEGIASIRLTVEEYAQLRGCSFQYASKLCAEGKVETVEDKNKTRGGRSGISYRIPLSSLPDKEIRRYLRKLDKEKRRQEADSSPEPESSPPIRLDYERLSAGERQELNRKNKILDDWVAYRYEEKRRGKSLAEADANYVRILQLQYPDMPMSLRNAGFLTDH